jgi:hypothetical protein
MGHQIKETQTRELDQFGISESLASLKPQSSFGYGKPRLSAV